MKKALPTWTGWVLFLISAMLSLPGAQLPVMHVLLPAARSLGLVGQLTATSRLAVASVDALRSWPYTIGSLVMAFLASRSASMRGPVRWLVWAPAIIAAIGTAWIVVEMGVAFGF
jgi:hypothetical protein